MESLVEPGRNRDDSLLANRFRLISLGEIMRDFYPTIFTHVYWYSARAFLQDDAAKPPQDFKEHFAVYLRECIEDCEKAGLHVSRAFVKRTLDCLEKNGTTFLDLRPYLPAMEQCIEDELLGHRFLQIDGPDVVRYQKPFEGWWEIMERFPDMISDIEEANKCYALARYAAAVFHSVQIVEHGMIALGSFLRVKDPLPGFTATSRELNRVLKLEYKMTPRYLKRHRAFLEQINGAIAPLQTAWRNKVNHAHGMLTVMTADFTPQVAEEILMASRGLMRRLAIEMPS